MLMLSLYILLSGHFIRSFRSKFCIHSLFPPIPTTYPARCIHLDFIVLTTVDDIYKSPSSLLCSLQKFSLVSAPVIYLRTYNVSYTYILYLFLSLLMASGFSLLQFQLSTTP